jgi:hypothetical protein
MSVGSKPFTVSRFVQVSGMIFVSKQTNWHAGTNHLRTAFYKEDGFNVLVFTHRHPSAGQRLLGPLPLMPTRGRERTGICNLKGTGRNPKGSYSG